MNNLTLHILTPLPWSCLNRDETQTPKRTLSGGALRGMLSSQSLKRAARVNYEKMSADLSVRSGNLAELAHGRALEINPELDSKKALTYIKARITALVKGPDKDKGSDSEKDEANESNDSAISSWLSGEELEAIAADAALGAFNKKTGKTDVERYDFIAGARTGSLSIAAFGRMFANAAAANTAAAVAVGPAISVHKTSIDTDYFATVDDAPIGHNTGSTFLGLALYTQGIFYRSLTIDRAQLKRSWTGFGSENAREQLSMMVESLISALPTGKKNSTSPYILPLAVIAEEQRYRAAYDFETPVQIGSEGGFAGPAVARLADQFAGARRMHASNFGKTTVAGTFNGLGELLETPESTMETLVSGVVDWILE